MRTEIKKEVVVRQPFLVLPPNQHHPYP
jgi:hypothetical protein